MKRMCLLFLLGLLFATTESFDSPEVSAWAAAADVVPSPVVVELFTSEGCSSCPSADALLSKLETEQPIAGATIIGLEEHVDYWNHDGWTDPYSSPEWTIRQQEYVARFKGENPYTPQMIVDGQKECSGNNVRAAQEGVQQAARQKKISVSVDAGGSSKSNALGLEVRVANSPRADDWGKADVWLAVTEAGLRTAVSAGENNGRTWEHASIVRSLQKIGSTSPGGSAPFLATPQVKLRSNWKKENLRIVVLLQERKSLRILGAATAKFSN